jgi:hypothetical protein
MICNTSVPCLWLMNSQILMSYNDDHGLTTSVARKLPAVVAAPVTSALPDEVSPTSSPEVHHDDGHGSNDVTHAS